MKTISVELAQRGLTVWAARTGDPSPGAVDDRFGDRTRAALQAFLRRRAPEYGLSTNYTADARGITLDDRLAAELGVLAEAYVPPRRRQGSSTPVSPPPPATVATGSSVPWIGLLVGAGIVGLGAWLLLRK